LGYRVFMASDPGRALDRYRQSPYDALVVDVGTTGEDGLLVCELIVKEAERQAHRCSFIVVLGKDQGDWRTRLPRRPSIAVLRQQKRRVIGDDHGDTAVLMEAAAQLAERLLGAEQVLCRG